MKYYFLLTYTPQIKILIGGDFNTHFSHLDKKNHKKTLQARHPSEPPIIPGEDQNYKTAKKPELMPFSRT